MPHSNRPLSAAAGFTKKPWKQLLADGMTKDIRYCKCRGCSEKLIKRDKGGKAMGVSLRDRGTTDLIIPTFALAPGF